MARSAKDHIPADVMAAAHRGGLEDPLWYVGRSNGHEGIELECTLDDVVRNAHEDAAKAACDPSEDN